MARIIKCLFCDNKINRIHVSDSRFAEAYICPECGRYGFEDEFSAAFRHGEQELRQWALNNKEALLIRIHHYNKTGRMCLLLRSETRTCLLRDRPGMEDPN